MALVAPKRRKTAPVARGESLPSRSTQPSVLAKVTAQLSRELVGEGGVDPLPWQEAAKVATTRASRDWVIKAPGSGKPPNGLALSCDRALWPKLGRAESGQPCLEVPPRSGPRQQGQTGRQLAYLVRRQRLDLHAQHVDVGGAYVLERMRREGRAPQGSWRAGRLGRCPAIHQDSASRVAPHEGPPAKDKENAWPAVRVDWGAVSWRDTRVEDSDSLVLEEERMVVGSSAKGVELRWPCVCVVGLL